MLSLIAFLLVCGSSLLAEDRPVIHTVLPVDAIPAIFSPTFVDASAAEIDDDAPMIGVSIDGEHHAYSMLLLNAHEIVNDTVGGRAIASTW